MTQVRKQARSHPLKEPIDLASGPGRDQDAYLLTATGLSPVQY